MNDELEEPKSVSLTPDRIVKVRSAQEDVKAGRVYTPERIRRRLQAKHDGLRVE